MTLLQRARSSTDHPTATEGWPLRRRAALAAVSAVAVSVLVLAMPMLLVWLASSQGSQDWTAAVGIGADGWLLAHGVGLGVGRATVSLTPWLLTAVPFLAAQVAARRLVSSLGHDERVRRLDGWGGLRTDVAETAVAFCAAYAVTGLAVSLAVRAGGVRPSLLASVLGPLLLSVLALLTALWREFRADLPTVAPGIAHHARHTVPPVVRRSLRPAVTGALVLLGAGGLLTVAMVVLHLDRVRGLYGALEPGLVGGTVLTIVQLAALPNTATWAVSWMAGPGFGIGAGSSITWSHSSPGLLPLLPGLGALPGPGSLPALSWLVVLAPVAVGALVGWRSLRALSRFSAVRVKIETAAASCLLCALLMTGAAWASGGALGASRLDAIGPSPLPFGGALLGELLLGAGLVVLGSWLRARRS